MSHIPGQGKNVRGYFITVEGGEGVGKSTQAKRLAAFLRSKGCTVVETREPGGTPFAETIRALVLDQKTSPSTAMSEALAMFAARKDHVATVIKPALARGEWVLCDRFTDSTRVYQGVLQEIGIEVIDELDQISLSGFAPDCTILFDSDPTISLSRVEKRGDASSKYDSMALEKHIKVREAFLQIARDAPSRVCVVDAGHAQEAVFSDMIERLSRLSWFQGLEADT